MRSLHFDFNVSLAEGEGNYLFIKNGRGSHTISIVDSGIEIVDPSSTELDLIVDQSGGAHFTLRIFLVQILKLLMAEPIRMV